MPRLTPNQPASVHIEKGPGRLLRKPEFLLKVGEGAMDGYEVRGGVRVLK